MTTTTSHALLTATLLAHIANTSGLWNAETTTTTYHDVRATTLWLWPTWDAATIVAVWCERGDGTRFDADIWTTADAPVVNIDNEAELADLIIHATKADR